MSLRLVHTLSPTTNVSDLSISTLVCVGAERVLAALTDGTLAVYDINVKGIQSAVSFYKILRSKQPFPRNEEGVVAVHAAWDHLHITRKPSPSYDGIQFVFTFAGGNKVYRTSLPPTSLVDGFFGGAPVETFAVQKESVRCLTIRMGHHRHGVLGTGSEDGVAMVWNLAHAMGDRGDSNLLTIVAHPDRPVTDMTFVRGNHLVFTASDDQAVRLWRVADGQLLQSLATGEMPVRTLGCRDEGRSVLRGMSDTLVVAGTASGSVFLWRVAHVGSGDTLEDVEGGGRSLLGSPMLADTRRKEQEDREVAELGTTHRLVCVSDHSSDEVSTAKKSRLFFCC